MKWVLSATISSVALAGCGSVPLPDTAEEAMPVSVAAPNSDSPTAKKKAALEFGGQLANGFTACQVSRAAVTLAIKKHDRLAAYEASGRGVDYCTAAANHYRTMNAPAGLSGDPQNTFPLIINTCEESATDQAETFRQMQITLDSDRLSDMAALDKQSLKAGASLDRCREGISGVLIAFGASNSDAKKVTWALR